MNINNTKKSELEQIYSNVLFVADLPKETTNDDLQNIFKNYHFLYATLNNFKNNSTWAQVYLESQEWATKARHELNGHILIPKNCINLYNGKPIRICKYEGKGASFNRQTNIKQSLLVKNIDINMSQKEFYKIFLEYGDITSAKIEYDENGISKGYGYIYYYSEEAAENAKENLNGKEFYGKAINIVNLIPQKKNKGNNITLFVLNIPNNSTENDIKNIFEKFGNIVNINVTNKGFAYVTYSNLESASNCLSQMKKNPISFPGCPNVVVKYASTKEERESNRNFLSNIKNEIANLNIQFILIYPTYEIKTDLDLDKEIRLFIKVIMLMEYSPKEVLVDMGTMSGLVTFGKKNDYDLFFAKYNEFCKRQQPPFDCRPYEIPIEEEKYMRYNNENFKNNNNYIYPQIYNNSYMPINDFLPVKANLMRNNPQFPISLNLKKNVNNKKQNKELDLIDQRNLQNLNPSQLQSQFNKPPINVCVPNMLDSKEQEELTNEIADTIYEISYNKYPNDAGKITGMIKEMGIEKMNMLLSKQEDLIEIIDQAHELLHLKSSQ